MDPLGITVSFFRNFDLEINYILILIKISTSIGIYFKKTDERSKTLARISARSNRFNRPQMKLTKFTIFCEDSIKINKKCWYLGLSWKS